MSYGSSRLKREATRFSGAVGGNGFIDLVYNDQRAIPVLAVSEEYGLLLHPGTTEAVALDVAGLVSLHDHEAVMFDASVLRIRDRNG